MKGWWDGGGDSYILIATQTTLKQCDETEHDITIEKYLWLVKVFFFLSLFLFPFSVSEFN